MSYQVSGLTGYGLKNRITGIRDLLLFYDHPHCLRALNRLVKRVLPTMVNFLFPMHSIVVFMTISEDGLRAAPCLVSCSKTC